MSKNIFKISTAIILLIVTIFFLMKDVDAASQASINCPTSVNLNDTFTVKLNLPAGVTGAQAKVTVKFSDESTKTDNIVYMNYAGVNMDSPASFKATVGGNATITISDILLSDGDKEIENGGSLSSQITIKAPTQPQNTTTNTETNTVTNTAVNTQTNTQVNTTTNTQTNTQVNTTTNTSNVTNTNNPKNNTTNNKTNTTNTTTTTQSFKEVNDTVVTNTDCRIRLAPNTNSGVVVTVRENTRLSRTGIGEEWSRINYNGKIGYIRNDLIEKDNTTNTNNTVKNTTNQVNNVVNNKINNNVNNVVNNNANNSVNNTTNTTVLTVEEQLKILKEEVGVLPEVGNNYAVIAYGIITIIALTVSVIIMLKYKKDV